MKCLVLDLEKLFVVDTPIPNPSEDDGAGSRSEHHEDVQSAALKAYQNMPIQVPSIKAYLSFMYKSKKKKQKGGNGGSSNDGNQNIWFPNEELKRKHPDKFQGKDQLGYDYN